MTDGSNLASETAQQRMWRDMMGLVDQAKLGAFDPQLRAELERLRAQMTLIRHALGLNPIWDVVEAVRVLYEDGRETFDSVYGGPMVDSKHSALAFGKAPKGKK